MPTPPNYGPRNPAIALQGFQFNVATKVPPAAAMYQKALDTKRAGRLLEAEQTLRALLQIDGGHADALHTLGIMRHRLGDSSEAEVLIRRAIAIRADAYFLDNLGNLLWELGKLDDAQDAYRHALAVKPDYVNAYVNLGTLLKKRGQYGDAEIVLAQALALHPQRADALCGLAFILHRSQRMQEALLRYRHALIVQPDYVDAYLNLGAVLRDMYSMHEALTCCEHALAITPDKADARLNHAIMLLQLGRYQEGWREYEYRWQLDDSEQLRSGGEKRWLGVEDLRGKSILLHAEQGHGDTLQFVRYASMVAARGARVSLLVQQSLKTLVTSCAGVHDVFSYDEELPSFDYQCPLMSLPLAFGTQVDSIPANVPYLIARADKLALWRNRLGPKTALRIGLAWAGEPRKQVDWANLVDRQRSLHFDQVWPLLETVGAGAQFYSLQIASAAAAQIAGEPRIIDYSAEIHDFEDTAALMDGLDLVITVDTSVAHLAGAVGKPAWLLDRYNHCWRWLPGREDSPWYPQMRIFRQTSLGDWAGVIERVRQALMAAVDSAAH